MRRLAVFALILCCTSWTACKQSEGHKAIAAVKANVNQHGKRLEYKAKKLPKHNAILVWSPAAHVGFIVRGRDLCAVNGTSAGVAPGVQSCTTKWPDVPAGDPNDM